MVYRSLTMTAMPSRLSKSTVTQNGAPTASNRPPPSEIASIERLAIWLDLKRCVR